MAMLLAVGKLSAQQILIKGKISDASDKRPIPYSIVLIKGTTLSAVADDNGCFRIKVRSLPLELVIYQFGYYTKEIYVKDTTSLSVELEGKAINLAEVNVTGKKVDTLQAKSNSVYLAFEFYDNFILALVNKGSKYNYVQLLNEEGGIIKEKKAPAGVESLFVDCFGNIQLVAPDFSYQFFYDYLDIIYLDKIPVSEFYSKLVPCLCVFGNYVYFKEVYHKQLKNRYFYISKNKIADRKIISEVYNKDHVQKFDYDHDINYFLAQRRQGAGYAMTVDEITSRLEELRENVPLTSDYLFMIPPVQSEMIKRDSSLLIIDYTNRCLGKYNFLGSLIKKDSLSLPGLMPGAVTDKDQNKFYLVGENSGKTTLYQPNNGEWVKKSIEEYKFIKNLRCKNGVFYFLYRDPVSGSVMKIHSYKF